ncbi:cytadherence high molecular weight protein 3 [Mycoplasmoides gallisepticum]|uniref:cytadherence high molecular weight protein 3 n=1 Tax=Mycoplasmoides gallisepticum TaxID=2096 RepID=UPI0033524539
MIMNPKIYNKILKNLAKLKKKAFTKYAAYDFNFAYDKNGKVYLVGVDNVTNQTFNLIKPVFKFLKKPLPAELYGMDQQPFYFINNHHYIDALNSDTGEQELLRYNVIDQSLVNAQTNDLVDPAFYTDLEGYELDLSQYTGSLLDLSNEAIPVEQQQEEENLTPEQVEEAEQVEQQQVQQIDPNPNEQPVEEDNQNFTQQYYDQQLGYADQNVDYGYDQQQYTQQQDYVDNTQQYDQAQEYVDPNQQYYDDQQGYEQQYDEQGYDQEYDQQGYDQEYDQQYYDDQQQYNEKPTQQVEAFVEQIEPVVDEVVEEQPVEVAKPAPTKPVEPKPQPGKKATKYVIKKPKPKPEVVKKESIEPVVEKEEVVAVVEQVVDQPVEVKKEEPIPAPVVAADDEIKLASEQPVKKKINLDDLQQIPVVIKLPKFETPKLPEPKADSEQKEEVAAKVVEQPVENPQIQETKHHHVLPKVKIEKCQEAELVPSRLDDHYDLIEEEDDDFFVDKFKFEDIKLSDLLVEQKPIEVNQPVVLEQTTPPVQAQSQAVEPKLEITKLEELVEIKTDDTESLNKLETLIDENKKIIDQFKHLKEEAEKSNSNINLEKVAKQLVDYLTNKLNEKTAALNKPEPSTAELNKIEQARQKAVEQLVHEQVVSKPREKVAQQPKEVVAKPYFEESDDLLTSVSNKPKQPTSELLDFLVQQVVDGEEDDLPPPTNFDKRPNQNISQKLDEINQVEAQGFNQTQFVPPQSLNQVETPNQRLFLEPEIQVQPQALYTASREHEQVQAQQPTTRIEREEVINQLQREPLIPPTRVAYRSKKEFDDLYQNHYEQRTARINPQDPYYDQGYEQPDPYQEQYLDQTYQQEAYQEYNRPLPPNQEYGYYPPAYESRRDYQPYQPRRANYEVRKPLAYEFSKQPAPRRYQQLPNRYNEFDQSRQLAYPVHKGTLRTEADFLRFREGYGYDYDRPSTQYYRSNYDTYVREVRRPIRQLGMIEPVAEFRRRALAPRRVLRSTYGLRRVSRIPSLAPRGYNQQPRVRRVPVSRGYW